MSTLNTHKGTKLDWAVDKNSDNDWTINCKDENKAIFDLTPYTFTLEIFTDWGTAAVKTMIQGDGLTNGGANGALTIALAKAISSIKMSRPEYKYRISYVSAGKTGTMFYGTLPNSPESVSSPAATSLTTTINMGGVNVNASITPGVSSSTIANALGAQTANRVYAGPSSGAAANPAFRAIVKDDVGFLSKFYYVGASNGSNDKAAIDAAVALAKANGGGAVIFNPGRYYLTSTIEYTDLRDIKFIGNGTTINSNFAIGDILYIHPSVTPTAGLQDQGIQGLVIDGFVFESSVKKTSGAAIRVQYSEFARIANIRIDSIKPANTIGQSKFYDGIYMEYQGACKIECVQVTCSHYGIMIAGANDTSGAGGTYFNYDGTLTGNFEIWGDRTVGSVGILLGGGTGGFHIEQGNVVLYETGVRTDKSLSAFVNREFFTGKFFIDSCDGYGLNVVDDSLQRLHSTGLWIAGTGRGAAHSGGGSLGCGIKAGTGVDRANLTGAYIYSCAGSGVDAASGFWTISGCTIADIGGGANGGDGITITGGAGVSNVSIAGNLFTGVIGNTLKGACIRLNNLISQLTVVGNTFIGFGQIGYWGQSHNELSKRIVRDNSGYYSEVYYFSDTFNSADTTSINSRTPSSATPFNWVRDTASNGNTGITSNAAKNATVINGQYFIETNIRNIDARWTVGTVPSSGLILGIFAFVDDNTKFQVNLIDGKVDQVLSGTATVPVAASGTSVSGDIIRANLNGTTLTIYRNGIQIGTGTVSLNVNGTKHGILLYQTSTGSIDAITTQAAS